MKSMKPTVRFRRMVGRIGRASAIAFVAATSAIGGTATDMKAVDNKAMDDKEMVVTTKSTSIWDQKELTGDWGGERTALREEGIDFTFNHIGDFLADVTGSQTHHATFFGRFRGTMDIDFKKLADVDGRLFVSGIYQYGRNLSGQFLDVFTLTSSIAGEESLRLDQAWYEQGFIDSKLKLKLGQIAAVNDFGSTGFFDILMNDELGYAANLLFRPNQPFSPAGKPGAELLVDPSGKGTGIYVKGGVFTAYRDPYHPDDTGLHWGNDFDQGWVGAAEIGYIDAHELYPASYKLGMTYNDLSGRYSNIETGELEEGNFVAYFTWTKTVYHPTEDGKINPNKGLDIFIQTLGAPEDRNPVRLEAMFGSRYTGLIPGREHDKVGFGIIYADAGTSFSNAQEAAGLNERGGETVVELTYQYQVAPWFLVQPDIQAIFDPQGDDNRSTILVLGLRTIVNF